MSYVLTNRESGRGTDGETGAAHLMRMLQAAAERRLVAVTDVVDRAHLMRVPEMAETDARDCHAVRELLALGLAQFGAFEDTLPWYGGARVHGKRVLPTMRGLTVLDRWRLHGEAVTLTAGWAGVA